MFDYLRSSYNLGKDFTDIELHTKDMERGLGGTLSHYWIDPSGQLFVMDYRDTHDIVDTPPLPLDKPNWWNPPFSYVPNGKHGKVSPVYLTDYVIVYPSQWDGEWKDWPDCRIHLINGKIQEFTDAKKGERFNMGY